MPEPRAWRARAALLAGAAAVLAACLVRGDIAVTCALAASPFLALAAMPGSWLRRPALIAVLALSALGAAVRPVVDAVVKLAPGEALRWDWLALACWCAAGLGLAVPAAALAAWRLGRRPWLGAPLALAAVAALLVVSVPLNLLYPIPCRTIVDPFAGAERLRIDADGIDLAAVWLEPAGPARGVVVFTHGKGAWKERHAAWTALAIESGWAVLAWDLRGHGASSLAAHGHGPVEADDLLVVWAEARRRALGRPVVAWGVSMGGAATLFAADRLEGCRALIIENAFAVLENLVVRNAPGPFAHGARLVARVGCGRWPRAIAPVEAVAEAQRMPPLLIGIGGADATVPPADGELLARTASGRADGTPVERVFVPDARHLGLIRAEPWRDAVRRLLDAAAR